MAPTQTTTPARCCVRFLGGVAYLGVVATFLSIATHHDFLLVLLTVVCGALFCSGVALTWLTLWAVRPDSRPGQFGVGSLFFLAVFVAMYFGTVRWIVLETTDRSGGPSQEPAPFFGIALLCLFLAAVSIPFVVGMTEALVWTAVWLVRRPRIRRWLLKMRGRR